MNPYHATHQNIMNALRESKSILLISHKKPDGDTLGSLTALVNYLHPTHKRVMAFCRDLPPQPFSYLPHIEYVTNDPETVKRQSFDLVIVFDSGDLRYAGVDELLASLDPKPKIINIDHHATNEHYGDINLVRVDAASTTEVLTHLLEDMNIPFTKHIATCLLTGLVTDTGGFTNPATGIGSLEAAAELVAHGAKLSDILAHVFRNKTLNSLKLWGKVLATLERNERLGITYAVIRHDDVQMYGVDDESTEGVANFLNSLSDTRVILVLKEQPGGTIKGSLRTTRNDIDVSRIAKYFGGGGHKKAAGFTVTGRLEKTQQGWKVV